MGSCASAPTRASPTNSASSTARPTPAPSPRASTAASASPSPRARPAVPTSCRGRSRAGRRWASVGDRRRQLADLLERKDEGPVGLQAQAVAVEVQADLAAQRARAGQLLEVSERELLRAPGDADDVQVLAL